MKTTDSVIVAFDYAPENGDSAVLIVGKKDINQAVKIINAKQGKEAIDLWNELTTIAYNKLSRINMPKQNGLKQVVTSIDKFKTMKEY